jgi:hypothetical protein
LKADFHFLEVAYPYVARRLLTDEDPSLRSRLLQVLFQDGKFRWNRLENLLMLAKEGQPKNPGSKGNGVDLTSTVADGARVVLLDDNLRQQLLLAFTEDNRLHINELRRIAQLIQGDVDTSKILRNSATRLPFLARDLAIKWSDRVLSS